MQIELPFGQLGASNGNAFGPSSLGRLIGSWNCVFICLAHLHIPHKLGRLDMISRRRSQG